MNTRKPVPWTPGGLAWAVGVCVARTAPPHWLVCPPYASMPLLALHHNTVYVEVALGSINLGDTVGFSRVCERHHTQTASCKNGYM